MKNKTMKLFRRMAPAVFMMAALALTFAVPVAGAADRSEFRIGGDLQWYDPRDWFERGGSVEHEADWFDYTFAYGQKGYYGFYGKHGEPLPFGYFGERTLNESPYLYDENVDKNYYTKDWYNREGMLEGWL